MCEGHSHHHDQTQAESVEMSPEFEISRRGVVKAVSALAGAAAIAPLGAAPAGATTRVEVAKQTTNKWKPNRYLLAGDHHIHTMHSPDATYTPLQQIKNGENNGLDWLVITDHGGTAHQKYAIDLISPEIAAARKQTSVHVFQGLEWNVPGAEHATVIVPPGRNTVDVLKKFEGMYDGSVLADLKKVTRATSTDGEPMAVEGLKWLQTQVQSGTIPMALMFANHPARKGLDSPHEVRAWRDTAPGIAVGWEGAPGHQMAAHPDVQAALKAIGSTTINGRGYYDNSPGADSFAGFAPTASENPYRTYGGYDWFTARVGGLWDSLLAEGKPWWITANSDSHSIFGSSLKGTHLVGGIPGNQDSAYYNTTGSYGAPVDSGAPINLYGDFAPGAYSRTIVGVAEKSYLGIMQSLKSGNIITTHGGIIDWADIRVTTDTDKQGVTIGGRTVAARGDSVTASITVKLASLVNSNGVIPQLKLVQLISGAVTGPVTDKDTIFAPQTTITESYTVNQTSGTVTFSHTWKNVQGDFYLRFRGGDGNKVDATGNPMMDVMGNASPWESLWFYTNPVFVTVLK
jgi:hypothetical protein